MPACTYAHKSFLVIEAAAAHGRKLAATDEAEHGHCRFGARTATAVVITEEEKEDNDI